MTFMEDLKSTHISVFVGLGITFVACILNTVALGSVGWGTSPEGRYRDIEYGLFRLCETAPTISLCVGYGQGVFGWLRATAAMRTIGTLLTISGIIGIVLFVLAFHGTKRAVYKAGLACLVVAVVSDIVGVAVFSGYWPSGNFGTMFRLAWVGTGIMLVGIVILRVAKQNLK